MISPTIAKVNRLLQWSKSGPTVRDRVCMYMGKRIHIVQEDDSERKCLC